MIIVEGPDGAGKSTLISRLQDDFPFPVAPRVVSKDTLSLVNLVHWVDQNLDMGLTPTIYDRHRLISEPIYGPVLRQTMEPGFDDMDWLFARQQELRSLEPFVIFCLPPIEHVVYNVNLGDDNKVVQEHIRTIYWLYFHAASAWGQPSWVWDYTKEHSHSYYQNLIENIEDWLERKGVH